VANELKHRASLSHRGDIFDTVGRDPARKLPDPMSPARREFFQEPGRLAREAW